jgi:ABC-type transport system involved in multi-copper enzyme maturation permease subunit
MTTWLIAHNTFREATRDRLLAGVIGAGMVLLAATQLLSPLAMGEGRRLTVDLGLSGISWLGLLVVLLVGTSLVAKELERRTIFNLLSRPISRPSYLVGKWVGLSATLWTVVLSMGLGLCALLALRGDGAFVPGVVQNLVLAGLELMVMTSIAVMCSALSTPVLSALYTLGFYIVGQWSYDLRAFAADAPGFLRGALEVTADLAPNLPLFNARTLAAGGQLTSWAHVGLAVAYAAVYSGCVLCLAAAAFESRDFK